MVSSPLPLLLALLCLLTLSTAAASSIPSSFDARQPSLLSPRQSPNTTDTPSDSDSDSGSTSGGGNATVSANTTQGACELTNQLSVNQQASWSNGVINTCCVHAASSTCYLRLQSRVSGADACTIPNCAALASADPARMLGFTALNNNEPGSNATGSNVYRSLGQGGAAGGGVGMAAGAAGVVAVVLALGVVA